MTIIYRKFIMVNFYSILVLSKFLFSQDVQEGAPYSQIYDQDINSKIISLPLLDHKALLEEDSFRDLETPLRYGFSHIVNYSPENSGILKTTIDGGMVWQVTFRSKGAYAISFEYEGKPIVKWKAGDYAVWIGDTKHFAANIGVEYRYTLQIYT